MGSEVHLRYRADIDGLRAVAVLAVVGSHIGLHFFAGGFVGVDVFFVISGFLMGSILLREIAATGTIDYFNFYERRLRRIMPALVVMLLIVSITAYLILLPREMLDFAKMSMSALFFFANIHLAQSTGYFGLGAAYNLLTHTWSLGVEEQFYIVLPLLLLACRKFLCRKNVGAILIVLASLSLLLSAVGVYWKPEQTFYSLATRFWELLAGTLTYLYGSRIKVLPPMVQQVIAWLAMGAIIVPIVLYSDLTVFPGIASLAPCAGAAALIATAATPVHKMLSSRICVGIGRISYSLYLWHWPVVVLNRSVSIFGHTSRHFTEALILAVSLILAYISWRWVEQPFRIGGSRPNGKTLFMLAGGTAAVFAAAFVFVVATNGAAYRYSPPEREIASYLQEGGSMEAFRVSTCFVENSSHKRLPDWNTCLRPKEGMPNYLLLGSSIVAQFYEAFQGTFPDIHFLQATAPNCNVRWPLPAKADTNCSALMTYIFKDYLNRYPIDAVVIQIVPDEINTAGLEALIRYLRDRGVRSYVIGPKIDYDRPYPTLGIAELRDPKNFHVERHIIGEPWVDDSAFRKATLEAGGTYLSMVDVICPGLHCIVFPKPLVPMAADRAHLTYAGSLYIVQAWKDEGLVGSPSFLYGHAL